MQRQAPLWIGSIGIAVIVAALVWMLGGDGERSSSSTPGDGEAGELGARELQGGDPGEGGVDRGTPQMSPEAARELAAHLARALDGGVRAPRPAEAPAAPAAAEEPPARTTLRIDRPLTPSDQLDYVAGAHDLMVIRRDDLRQRLAQLEASGQGDSDQANRVRWELERLAQAEPSAEQRAADLAERVHHEAEQAPPSPAP